MPTKYIVNADHRVEKYRVKDMEFTFERTEHGGRIGVDGNERIGIVGYYADLRWFGCGKTRKTPEGAITELLFNNGCQNIHIRKEEA